MTNLEAIKNLYIQLGGEAAIIASAQTNVDALNAIAGLYQGETTATTTAEAIENIATVAENIGRVPVLVEKTITENGTYDPADDEADGYSSVIVAIPEPAQEPEQQGGES